MAEPTITDAMIEAAAAAIANARGGRRGAPAISNILAILPQKLKDEFLEDAERALKAALALRSAQPATSVPIPAPGSEERDFWLEAAEQHGFMEPDTDEAGDTDSWLASEEAILKLIAASREQGRRDILIAFSAGGAP